MRLKLAGLVSLAAAVLPLLAASLPVPTGGSLTLEQSLGKSLFLDGTLSTPREQACGSCHLASTGFTAPDSVVNATGAVMPGAVHSLTGFRKPPTITYMAFSPPLHYDPIDETYVGGQFWDGRVDNLMEQAKLPFLNPVEMNNASMKEVCDKVRTRPYAPLFDQVYGPGSLDPKRPVSEVYDLIVKAIAAFETSTEVNPFSSKYDAYLTGKVSLSAQEMRGLQLFEGKANCAACHPSQPGPDGSPPLFTDFTYDNIGVPRNPANPFYKMPPSINPDGANFVDLGLGKTVNNPDQDGKFKVPTLRNLDKRPHYRFVKAFMHNGVFKSLEEVVHFYNTRDLGTFPPPEVERNVNHEELGNLEMTWQEEQDLVAFLRTLSDGYTIPAKH